ncbi:hypothetical protein CYMTET_18995 [Cymbomonas tetramitiformis]|uniref:Uncharacterized protein n=1 Tax=Cymbomonas tetramitiformis TaxID=36881 RepID=A0AAE0CC67_9CHLO|nr:hypothetical protein CYMTET_39495 [Cymbomonas tetramitiformis]KAK3272726.1 hypothetical protein CYMTET_18995 [Cymbomonas tetramitiformis]
MATPASPTPPSLADLRTIIILDLKRQLAAFTASDGPATSPRGYTPRADKPDRRMKTRFATKPLTTGGNCWSHEGTSKKAAFHRDTGATVPYVLPKCDVISGTGFTAVEAPGPEPYVHMNMLSAVDRPGSGDGCATDETGDEGVAPMQPPTRLGCGAPVTGFGRSFIASSLMCARFVMCTTAAPLTASGVGGAGAHVCTAPTVGGAGWAAPAAAMPAALPPAGSPDEWDPGEGSGDF